MLNMTSQGLLYKSVWERVVNLFGKLICDLKKMIIVLPNVSTAAFFIMHFLFIRVDALSEGIITDF